MKASLVWLLLDIYETLNACLTLKSDISDSNKHRPFLRRHLKSISVLTSQITLITRYQSALNIKPNYNTPLSTKMLFGVFGRNHSRRTGYCEKSPGACPGSVWYFLSTDPWYKTTLFNVFRLRPPSDRIFFESKDGNQEAIFFGNLTSNRFTRVT